MFEDYDNLSSTPADTNFATSIINANSRLIRVVACHGNPTAVSFPGVPLRNGVSDPATFADYLDESTHDPEQRRGLAGLSDIPEISLIGVPDKVVMQGLRDKVIAKCEAMLDRFAVCSVDANIANIANLRPPRDSSYAAIYYPWIRVFAPHTPAGHLLVPSVGNITGIFARVDTERGVHKAPANEVVRGIVTQADRR